MCVTIYQISYCRACISYIESRLLGTVFCDDQRQKKPCEAQIQFQESYQPGPCAACRQPIEVVRRSQRIRQMRRNAKLPDSYRVGGKRSSEDSETDDDEDDDEEAAAV